MEEAGEVVGEGDGVLEEDGEILGAGGQDGDSHAPTTLVAVGLEEIVDLVVDPAGLVRGVEAVLIPQDALQASLLLCSPAILLHCRLLVGSCLLKPFIGRETPTMYTFLLFVEQLG